MAKTPKYMEIVIWTMKQMESGAFLPEDKFLSETALGEKFKFSRQTVRRALEVLEQQGSINRVHGSGTYISSKTSKQQIGTIKDNKTIKVVGLISTYMDNYIFPNIVRGIQEVMSQNGYILQLASTNNLVSGETKALELMVKNGIDALIVNPTRSALPCVNIDLYNSIIEKGIPLLFIDSFYPSLTCPYVALDDVMVGYVATNHLIKKGHRNILGVFPHSHRQGHLRYLGYTKALIENNIDVVDDNICWYAKADKHELMHRHQLTDFIDKCSAALCFNDRVALNLIEMLEEQNKNVPEDISVMGIDDSELAQICSITTIVHPAKKVGIKAAEMIVSMINGVKCETYLFPPKLIERDSVKQLV